MSISILTRRYFAVPVLWLDPSLAVKLNQVAVLILTLGRQLAILGRQLDFCDLISPVKIKISKIRYTNFLV